MLAALARARKMVVNFIVFGLGEKRVVVLAGGYPRLWLYSNILPSSAVCRLYRHPRQNAADDAFTSAEHTIAISNDLRLN